MDLDLATTINSLALTKDETASKDINVIDDKLLYKQLVDKNREEQRQKERERIAKIEKELADYKKIEEIKVRAEMKKKEEQTQEYKEMLEKKEKEKKELEQKEKDYVYKNRMNTREDKVRLRMMQTKLTMERLKDEAKNQKRY